MISNCLHFTTCLICNKILGSRGHGRTVGLRFQLSGQPGHIREKACSRSWCEATVKSWCLRMQCLGRSRWFLRPGWMVLALFLRLPFALSSQGHSFHTRWSMGLGISMEPKSIVIHVAWCDAVEPCNVCMICFLNVSTGQGSCDSYRISQLLRRICFMFLISWGVSVEVRFNLDPFGRKSNEETVE